MPVGKTGRLPIHTGKGGGVVKFNSNMGKNSQQGGATGASGPGTQANVAQAYQKRYDKKGKIVAMRYKNGTWLTKPAGIAILQQQEKEDLARK